MFFNRRQTLIGLGFASTVLLTRRPAAAPFTASGLARLPQARPLCSSTRQAAEGPFYLDGDFNRSDITEGCPGLPLDLTLAIVAAGDCDAVPQARVDIWHADANGCYSGFQGQGDERTLSTVERTFLRGSQRTDRAGRVSFRTIYPGWYAGRAAHVHYKVFVDDRPASVGQFYFPEALNRFVFTTVAPYNRRARRRDTLNSSDPVLRSHGGRGAVVTVHTGGRRLSALLTVAVEI